MSYQVVIPVIISFVVSAVLGPIVIPFLRKLKVGQTEREELKSHLKKTGTPTMGGIIILASVILTSLIYVKDYPKIIPILFVTVGFGIVGFLDDYLKVVLKRSDGLLAWQKMLCQIVITAIFVFYILKFTDVSLTMLIPFSGGKYLNLGVLAIPVMFGASLIKIIKFGFGFSALEAGILLTGMITAFIVSLFVIKFLMGYIKKHDFKVFGWYRIILGVLVLGYFALAG